MTSDTHDLSGIGMTSARTRERLVDRLRQSGIKNEAVLDRIRNTPRHLFVDEALGSRAYEDTALPIGHGQTISQPYVVAKMTEALLEEGRPKKVLEIGTGSGYQTAVMAPLVGQVFSIERVAPLMRKARTLLKDLGVSNVRFRHDDGFNGWPGQAPFDGIIVAAAPADIPAALLNQLSSGGRLIIPVGPKGKQKLVRIRRDGDNFERKTLGLVSFVPLLEGRC